MEWIKGSCDSYGRLYIKSNIREIAGVIGGLEYTIEERNGASVIVVRKKEDGNGGHKRRD